MIYIELPATRKPALSYTSSASHVTSLTGLLTASEAIRRDNIIKQIYSTCFFKRGDLVRPISEAAFAKYESLGRIPPVEYRDWETDRKSVV